MARPKKQIDLSQDLESRLNSIRMNRGVMKTIVEVLTIEKNVDVGDVKIDDKDTNRALVELRAYQLYTQKIQELIDYFSSGAIIQDEDISNTNDFT